MELNPYEPPRESCLPEPEVVPEEGTVSTGLQSTFQLFCTALFICFGWILVPIIVFGVIAIGLAVADAVAH